MPSPTSIDTRLVLRIYTWIVLSIAILLSQDPLLIPAIASQPDLPDVTWGRAGIVRLAACAVSLWGFAALGMSGIENPVSRQRALKWFGIGHIYFGLFFSAQSYAVFREFIPQALWFVPTMMGVVLLYIALTCAHAPRFNRPFRGLFDSPDEPADRVVVLKERGAASLHALRSQYEEQIHQAARVEERTRLARDLHDAVKQQLFAIQTSAATVQERFETDTAGAKAALEQVRASVRDAMSEMKALIEQLQASPLENTGLVAALQQQCEALALRTGADVRFEAGALPPNDAVLPGTQQGLFRAAQEALANVARHARAAHVWVRLGLRGDRLELTVRDDGAGFDPVHLTPGMGLKNMSARVHEISGMMLFSPQPQGGTLVTFSVPCDLTTARDYAQKAWLWLLVVALAASNLAFADSWEKPWAAIAGLLATVTVARYAAAWWRTRGRQQVAIA
jgi:signal transduction histidine kinase